MFDLPGQHQFLELLGRRRHRTVTLSEGVALHSLVLQVDDRLRRVPTVVSRCPQVVIDDIARRNGYIARCHPLVIVDILFADLFQHLLFGNPKVRQQLETVVFVEEQHVSCNVRHVREVQTAPAGAPFQIGRRGHPARLVRTPVRISIHQVFSYALSLFTLFVFAFFVFT